MPFRGVATATSATMAATSSAAMGWNRPGEILTVFPSALTWGRSGQGGRIRVTSADLQYLFGIQRSEPDFMTRLTWGRSGQGGRIRVTSADLQYLFGIQRSEPDCMTRLVSEH